MIRRKLLETKLLTLRITTNEFLIQLQEKNSITLNMLAITIKILFYFLSLKTILKNKLILLQ